MVRKLYLSRGPRGCGQRERVVLARTFTAKSLTRVHSPHESGSVPKPVITPLASRSILCPRVLVGEQRATAYAFRSFRSRHDYRRIGCVVGNEFATDAARRDNLSGTVHGHDHRNSGVASGSSHADCNGFRTHCDTTHLRLKMGGSEDRTRPGAHCTTDVVPILTLPESNDRPCPVEKRNVGVVQYLGHGQW